jgi:carbamoyltransferase
MSVNILGISAFFHDSAAALVRDGEIIAAAQEERFTRHKGDPSFPRRAITYCLSELGLEPGQLDAVVFYEKPLVKLERLLETYLAYAPLGFESFRRAAVSWAETKLHIPELLRTELGEGFRGDLYFTEHHESHAASAFFPSPFEAAAILTLDAVGEWTTSSIGLGRDNRVEISHEMRFPHSMGMLYSAFTYYAGFKVNSGEYKLMGLAPYGEPRYADVILKEIAEVREDGSLWLDMSYFNFCQGLTMTSERFHQLFGGPPRKPESLITQKEMDLAASVQVVCEEVVLRATRHAHRLSGLSQLVMAGGVALNCVANGRVLREGPFRDVWIQPAAGDAGAALGAALTVWHHVLGQPRHPQLRDSQKGSLLGPSFDDDFVSLFLDTLGATYEHVTDEAILVERVARLLDQEKVIGWFHGRMEYGPRALGARSIIGDARSPRMQQIMNLKIKFRESFRPFAPCVLAECVDAVFETRPAEDSPYMLLVAPVRTSWRTPLSVADRERLRDPDLRVRVSVPRSRIPAVTHVDYSARIQTVDPARHGRFYRMMRAFYELTGCPVIVNTSFNVRGEPIVCTPDEAFRCFMSTDLDVLVLGDYVLLKDAQPDSLRRDPAAYLSQYELD